MSSPPMAVDIFGAMQDGTHNVGGGAAVICDLGVFIECDLKNTKQAVLTIFCTPPYPPTYRVPRRIGSEQASERASGSRGRLRRGEPKHIKSSFHAPSNGRSFEFWSFDSERTTDIQRFEWGHSFVRISVSYFIRFFGKKDTCSGAGGTRQTYM